nr:rRNA methylase leader peptide [Enterococcus faecium]
MLVFQMRYQMR